MVLRLKTWESRSPPNLERSTLSKQYKYKTKQSPPVAGWSSPVARQAHNLKAAGSNPAPATKNRKHISELEPDMNSRVFACAILVNAWSTFDESPYAGDVSVRADCYVFQCHGSRSSTLVIL